jgi:hypothetical protein
LPSFFGSLPEHFEGLPLGVVVDARKPAEGAVGGLRRRHNALDQVKALANFCYLTRRRQGGRHQDPRGGKHFFAGLSDIVRILSAGSDYNVRDFVEALPAKDRQGHRDALAS